MVPASAQYVSHGQRFVRVQRRRCVCSGGLRLRIQVAAVEGVVVGRGCQRVGGVHASLCACRHWAWTTRVSLGLEYPRVYLAVCPQGLS